MNLQYLKKCINNYKNSEEYQLMLKGDSYYKVQNDIKDRVIGRINKQGYIQTDVTKANNKLSHGIYKNLVDEWSLFYNGTTEYVQVAKYSNNNIEIIRIQLSQTLRIKHRHHPLR